MAASEIDVPHARKELAKTFFCRRDGPLQAVGVLFAEVVPVQARHPVQQIGTEVLAPDAQT